MDGAFYYNDLCGFGIQAKMREQAQIQALYANRADDNADIHSRKIDADQATLTQRRDPAAIHLARIRNVSIAYGVDPEWACNRRRPADPLLGAQGHGKHAPGTDAMRLLGKFRIANDPDQCPMGFNIDQGLKNARCIRCAKRP